MCLMTSCFILPQSEMGPAIHFSSYKAVFISCKVSYPLLYIASLYIIVFNILFQLILKEVQDSICFFLELFCAQLRTPALSNCDCWSHRLETSAHPEIIVCVAYRTERRCLLF